MSLPLRNGQERRSGVLSLTWPHGIVLSPEKLPFSSRRNTEGCVLLTKNSLFLIKLCLIMFFFLTGGENLEVCFSEEVEMHLRRGQ